MGSKYFTVFAPHAPIVEKLRKKETFCIVLDNEEFLMVVLCFLKCPLLLY